MAVCRLRIVSSIAQIEFGASLLIGGYQLGEKDIKVLMAKNYVDNLSEEVRKGLKEKAEQGHFPGVAHVGYVNNRTTHRIEVDPVRGPLAAEVFRLYATGQFSLSTLTQKAFQIGLRHHRSHRKMVKSEIHRMLRTPSTPGTSSGAASDAKARMNRSSARTSSSRFKPC